MLALVLIMAAVFVQPAWARALAMASLLWIGTLTARHLICTHDGAGKAGVAALRGVSRSAGRSLARRLFAGGRERLALSVFHDLRTPIMRLKLRAELLEDEALRQDLHEDLDDLDMMVKEALQSVKGNDFHENTTEVKLGPLIEGLAKGARLTTGRNVKFTGTHLRVMAEPLGLKRMLGNLLDNALRYGGAAEISVTESDEAVLIRIRDHGPGIPAAALRRLSRPFVRLPHGKSRNAEGLGLGLSIARDIADSMGGKLKLSNHPRGGLVAAVFLPAIRAGQAGIGRMLPARAG